MGDFEADTRVEGDSGRYTATLSDRWAIWGPNGGYIASIALRAAGAESVFDRPTAFSCQFLAAGRFDDVDIEVESIRRGRSAEALGVRMKQGDRTLLTGLAWTTPAADDDTPTMEHDHAPMPDVPGVSELVESRVLCERSGDQLHPFWQNFERWPTYWVPPGERVARPPAFDCWHRFVPNPTFDCPFADAARSLLLIDTNGWPAAHRPYVDEQPYIAPSLDVNVHFHRSARGCEHLLARAEAPIATEGLIGTRGRVWDTAGRLVASGSAQLLVRPMPKEPQAS